MKLSFLDLPQTLLNGAQEVADILKFEIADKGIPVRAVHDENGLFVSYKDNLVTIGYSQGVEFYRGLGLFVENYAEGNGFELKESAKFKEISALFDNSRNGVLQVGTIKKMLRHMALMGFNQLLLYTEDTYEIEKYPYFGYMRGRFSADEIRECDQYAKMLGIELVPCVQTLAHLNAAFKWPDFQAFNDCGDIMLIGDDKTYEFIDAMLASLSKMFTSRKINIGMDEANMVGLGKYLERNGYQERFALMMEHLKKVITLCHKYGFQPTMWSDMFFNLLSQGYYGTKEIDESIYEKIPSDVTLAYWDYYSTEKETYDKNIEKHLKFKNEIVFTGGAWKWMGMVPCNQFSFKTSRLALQSCIEHQIKKVIVTGWGDNGAECSSFATLPALQLFAEFCYSNDNSDQAITKRLKTCANANFEDFMNLDLPNLLPGNDAPGECSVNPSKYLLFQDILCGLFDRHVEIGKYNSFFAASAATALSSEKSNPQWVYLFETNACLCSVLEIKCDIGLRIQKAYAGKELDAMREISRNELPELLARVEKLHEAMRRQWFNENKIFGFDVQDIRFGALKERIHAAKMRIDSYVSGEIDCLEELQVERLDYMCRKNADACPHISVNLWSEIVTPNVI